MLHVLAGVAGVVLVLATLSSVVRTIVLPRGSRSRLVGVTSWLTSKPLELVADRTGSLRRSDAVQAWAAPLAILVTLAAWLLCLLAGYGLLLAALSRLPLTTALREAGSSLLTLGFASTDRGRLTAVDFAAAASGPLIVALQIGYLPALYASYNRRETEVTMLQTRAGEPNWGPEILARHSSIGTLERLDDLFLGWERWAADVSESHTNYPILISFRSPDPRRNWLVALVSVMDAAALQLALNPQLRQGAARMAVRAGFVCVRELGRVEGLAVDHDPDPDAGISLGYDEFAAAVAMLRDAGYPMSRTPQEAWPHFRGWRVNYEALAYELCRRIDAVPALWTGSRRVPRASMPPLTPRNRQPGGTTGRPRTRR